MYVSFCFCNTPPTCNHHNRHSFIFFDVALYSGVTQVGIRNSLRSNNMYTSTTPARTAPAGKACSDSCVLFSYSCKNRFDLTAESFACTFFTCYVIFGTSSNRWRSRKPYGTPLAKRRSIALLIVISPPHQLRTAAHTQAMTHAPFYPCLIGLPPTRSGSPLTSSIPLPVKLGAVWDSLTPRLCLRLDSV